MLAMKIPAISMLIKRLSKFIAEPGNRGSGIILARRLVDSLLTRFHEYKTTLPDCVSTLLNPRYKCLLFTGEEKNTAIMHLNSFAFDIIVRNKNSEPVADNDILTASASITRATITGTEAARTNAACFESDLWADLDDMHMVATSNEPTLLASDNHCKELEQYIKESPIIRTSSLLQ